MSDPRIVPANRVSREDLDLVMRDGGDASSCRCQWFKLPQSQWQSTGRDARDDALAEQAGCGHPDAAATSGPVAYVDDEPAGWVAVEPRVAYPRLRTARIPWTGRDEDRDDAGVWAVTCFVVRRGFRGRGLAKSLAVAAVAHAQAGGATAVEGYPRVDGGTVSDLFVGSASVFAAAGMTEVSRPTPLRAVMRVEL
ncbi:GNAT family N-acetyltransferase [Demequina sp. SYSU T00192]|uniref:GNAT family N-acetyltransferase n=1 Tax=Demequina litoralis TaxID=3051660 RepID=A0ABT8G9Q5_9MICO|nr:GNAT family N-acetyltransferase [Demequina sp. SYSU T00192]MDN4475862.1 GNAT family N-acetyltransferase [Demequina sp. SYSU T00192]